MSEAELRAEVERLRLELAEAREALLSLNKAIRASFGNLNDKGPVGKTMRTADELLAAAPAEPKSPRFPDVGCSQCGGSFGPGDHGYSHCTDHGGSRYGDGGHTA